MVVAVDTGEEETPFRHAQEFRDDHKLTYPLLVDGDSKVAGKFGVHAFPTNLLIDSEGVVRYVGAGFDPDELNRVLAKLVKQGEFADNKSLRR